MPVLLYAFPVVFCLCARSLSLAGLSVGDVRKVDYAMDAIAAEDPFVDPDPLDEVVLEVLCLSSHPPPFPGSFFCILCRHTAGRRSILPMTLTSIERA